MREAPTRAKSTARRRGDLGSEVGRQEAEIRISPAKVNCRRAEEIAIQCGGDR